MLQALMVEQSESKEKSSFTRTDLTGQKRSPIFSFENRNFPDFMISHKQVFSFTTQ